MSPMDAIRPPKKRSKNAKPQKTISGKKPARGRSAFGEKVEKPIVKEELYTPRQAQNKQKESIMWLMVAGAAVIIIIFWVITLPSNNNSGGEDGLIATLGDKIDTTWESIKTDIFKIDNALGDLNEQLGADEADTSTNSENSITDDQTRELEEQIFPQFSDPTRQ